MNIADTKAGQVLALGALAALAAWYLSRKAADATAVVATALNPTSRENIAYSAINSIGAELSGNQSFSLGSWIYDFSHPDSDAIREAVEYSRSTPAVPAMGAAGSPDSLLLNANVLRAWFGLDPITP